MRVSDGALVHDFDANLTPTSYGATVVAFTPNGDYLVAGMQQYVSGAGWRGALRFWKLEDERIAAQYDEGAGVTSLAFSRAQDHRLAYTLAGGDVKVANVPFSMAAKLAGVPRTTSLPYRLDVSPNPFATRLRLTLRVDRGQEVRAELFDPVGRRVASLFRGRAEAGASRSIDVEAAGLPNGIYVVHVVGEDFTGQRRVALLR